jgi:predicted nucleic acid-binding protein
VALSAHYIADKSALSRMRHAAVANVLEPLILAGDVGTCAIVELEVLYSSISASDLRTTRSQRATAFPRFRTTEADFETVADLMAALADGGRHRAAGVADLLIAAVAIRHDVTVYHYDADFDQIAAVSPLRSAWVVPKGSLP